MATFYVNNNIIASIYYKNNNYTLFNIDKLTENEIFIQLLKLFKKYPIGSKLSYSYNNLYKSKVYKDHYSIIQIIRTPIILLKTV